jgi:DNA-binding MarR family transcriptional regulator
MEKDEFTLGLYIRRTNILLDRNLSLIIAKNNAHGGTQGMVLKYISHSNKDVFQKDLEECFGVRRSTMSEILDSLQRDGFIIRQVSEQDKRMNKILLTSKGLNEVNLMQKSMDEFDRLLQQGISEKEKDEFIKTINKVLVNLKKMEEEEKWTK